MIRSTTRTVAFGFTLAVALGLGGCARPPPDAYANGAAGGDAAPALDIGANAAQEACTLQTDPSGARIYCGDYVQAAGHVLKDAQATDPGAFVTDSPWRTAFDRRFQCGDPHPTTVLDAPAVTLACTRRQGGWPQVVVATRLDGALYVADGVRPVEPVIARAIGVLAGRLASVVPPRHPKPAASRPSAPPRRP